jgi:hypothetical protein
MAAEGVLEYRLRRVADMLDQAASELKSSIAELEVEPEGVNHERRTGSETGRHHRGVAEGS